MEKQKALNRLTEALVMCKEAGIKLGITKMYSSGTSTLGILFSEEVVYNERTGKLVEKNKNLK